jgi:hypothetical protein
MTISRIDPAVIQFVPRGERGVPGAPGGITYASRAAAGAETISGSVTAIILLGYSSAGDGGGPALYVEVPETGTLMPWQFRSNGGTRRWQLAEVTPTPMMLGAKRDGVTSDTAALDALFDYVKSRTASGLWKAGMSAYGNINDTGAPAMSFPPGDYVYTGSGWSHNGATDVLSFGMRAQVPGTVRIRIPDAIWLLTMSGGVNSFFCEGIQFYGGKGFVHPTGAAVNVRQHMTIEDCAFFDYTTCAIGHESTDFPYWKINRNVFYGRAGASSIGVALKGLQDQSEISGNSFLNNKYHLKLPSTPNLRIEANDFLRFETTSPAGTADVWLVPREASDTSGNNGDNIYFTSNKFGNENLKAGDFRILVADESSGSGTDNATRQHALTQSTGIVDNVILDGGLIASNDAWVAGGVSSVVYSYATKVSGVSIGEDVCYQGGFPDYFFRHGYDPTSEQRLSPNVARFVHGDSMGQIPAPQLASHAGRGLLLDPLGHAQGQIDSLQHWGAGDCGTLVGREESSAVDSSTSATITNVVDAYNNANGARNIEFTAGGGLVVYNATGLTAGRRTWVEFDILAGAALPLNAILADIGYDNVIGDIRCLRVPSVWQTIRIPTWSRLTNLALTLRPLPVSNTRHGFSAGVRTQVRIGRVAIYQGASPRVKGIQRLPALVFAGQTNTPAIDPNGAPMWFDTSTNTWKGRKPDGTVHTFTTV